MKPYLFFDTASTTKCCKAALERLARYSEQDYGHPSSSHPMGKAAAKAIQEAREYFAGLFGVAPAQVVFTSGGTESDNLAVYGVAGSFVARKLAGTMPLDAPVRFVCTAIEHPAVWSTVDSLVSWGFERKFLPVDRQCQPVEDEFRKRVTPHTAFVSMMSVNNITGARLPVERFARIAKEIAPGCVFHTDAVQAFGKIDLPRAGSPVDLVSISAHKIGGPKGIGALIALNPSVLRRDRFRPFLWGGDQEGGWRSGTPSPALISAFAAAAQECLGHKAAYEKRGHELVSRLRGALAAKGVAASSGTGDPEKHQIVWNSPADAIPYVVSLSLPGRDNKKVSEALEKKGFFVATGSACSSGKGGPDRVLEAMGLPTTLACSGIRVSFCCSESDEDIRALADALCECLAEIPAT